MQSSFRTGPTALWPFLLPVLLAGIVFLQVGGFAFVNLDDDIYVTENPLLNAGSAGDAFTATHAEVWIPLTWLSLRADRTLQGPGPAGFHRTNLLLHLLNVVLVTALLRRLLDGRWAVVLAAALFAVHPLQVEAVAWVTARKDLLAGCCTLAALLVHVSGRGGRLRIPATVVLAAAAMLAKPAAVVLPAWLVLLDGWRARRDGRPLREALTTDRMVKLATLAVALAVAVVAVRLARGGEYGLGEPAGLVERVGQGAFMILVWLGRFLVPRGLAPIYPPASWAQPAGLLALATAAVAALTAVGLVAGRRRPAVAAGWLWFLVGVAPAVGIVRGGQLLMSDRYLYLPLLGLAVLAADLLGTAVANRPRWRRPVAVLAIAGVLALAGTAWQQASHWRDATALWTHTLAVTTGNATAHTSYAVVLDADGRPAEALVQLETALRIAPHSLTHYNAGNILRRLDRPDEAAVHFRAALRRDPELLEAALNLGALLAETGRTDEALAVLKDARQRRPEAASVHYNLGLVRWLRGERDAAVRDWQAALARDPGHAGAREMLARAATSPPASRDSSGP